MHKKRQWTDASPDLKIDQCTRVMHADKKFRGSPPAPYRPRTFFGPSASQELSDSVWMTEIGQSVFELREPRKEEVGRSIWYTHTLALLHAWSLAPLWLLYPKGNSRGTWHVTPKHIFSVAHRFGAWGRNIPQWPPDSRNKPMRALINEIESFIIVITNICNRFKVHDGFKSKPPSAVHRWPKIQGQILTSIGTCGKFHNKMLCKDVGYMPCCATYASPSIHVHFRT